jgi:hypothetical protein
MALSKEKNIDQIEVTSNGIIQVRESTKIVEDGNVLSTTYHRWVLTPGQDLTDQADNVKAIANAAWTTEVVTAYQQRQAQIEAEILARNAE